MITATEIDFIVSDSLKALALYKEIFEVHVVEATKYPIGRNQVVFNLYDTRFHMLDANEEFGLKSTRFRTSQYNLVEYHGNRYCATNKKP